MLVKINGKKVSIDANFDPKGVANKSGGKTHCATGWPKPTGLLSDDGWPIYCGLVITSKPTKTTSGDKAQQA